jgi:hypothetical protein
MTKPIMIQDVARVEWATRPLDEISTKEAVEQLVGGGVESSSNCTGKVVGRPAPREGDFAGGGFRLLLRSRGVVHPMVGAIHQAYQDHRPLVLSPDMFWLLVTQACTGKVVDRPAPREGDSAGGGFRLLLRSSPFPSVLG